jgi:hypothetical protein
MMMTDISYEEVVKLVDQLPPKEQTALIAHLLELARQRDLTKEERKTLFHASILNVPVANVPSPRREDWYDDDGR